MSRDIILRTVTEEQLAEWPDALAQALYACPVGGVVTLVAERLKDLREMKKQLRKTAAGQMATIKFETDEWRTKWAPMVRGVGYVRESQGRYAYARKTAQVQAVGARLQHKVHNTNRWAVSVSRVRRSMGDAL